VESAGASRGQKCRSSRCQRVHQVDDIDAALKAIKKRAVLKPRTEIGQGMGAWASFADNQGAVLFLWEQGAAAQQTNLPM
jgi:predicted enzyme related to lactoylglutathione lyase